MGSCGSGCNGCCSNSEGSILYSTTITNTSLTTPVLTSANTLLTLNVTPATVSGNVLLTFSIETLWRDIATNTNTSILGSYQLQRNLTTILQAEIRQSYRSGVASGDHSRLDTFTWTDIITGATTYTVTNTIFIISNVNTTTNPLIAGDRSLTALVINL